MVRDIVGKNDIVSLRLGADAHLQRRHVAAKPPAVHREPMTLLQIQEHRGIATRGDEPAGRGALVDLVGAEKRLDLEIVHAVLAIQQEVSSSVDIQNGSCPRQRLDLQAARLAVFAVAGDMQDGLANRSKLDSAARTLRDSVP